MIYEAYGCLLWYYVGMNKISHDSETVAQGQQVITACAFIYHQFDGVEKLFLAKRAATKRFLPGVYELPGGHIDIGEDPVDGLKREIGEELGMHVEVGDPFYVFTYTESKTHTQTIEIVYFATFSGGSTVVTLNPQDHSEYGWFALADIHDAYTSSKGADDPEFKAIRKGFAHLRGQSLVF